MRQYNARRSVKLCKELLATAERLTPRLRKRIVRPKRLCRPVYDEQALHHYRMEDAGDIQTFYKNAYGRDASFVLDFGEHMVGYLMLSIRAAYAPADAPLRLKLTFGEVPSDIALDPALYNGSLSKSWLPVEVINIDAVPCKITLPRRYSFRYLKVEIVDTSDSYEVKFRKLNVTAVTSADLRMISALDADVDPLLKRMDEVSIATLRDCMQSVFEDGPRRNRQLRLGDLRLQALVNYETVKNYDLVKRCLYLFAGLPMQDGRLSAYLILEPKPHVARLYFCDYALVFVSILKDYYRVTGDRKTLRELYGIARKQVRLAARHIGDSGLIEQKRDCAFFIDCSAVEKHVSAQGVFIYTLNDLIELAEEMRDIKTVRYAKNLRDDMREAVLGCYDESLGLFVSGGQISYASQIWMILSDSVDTALGREMLLNLLWHPEAVAPNTPYLYHYYVEALYYCGMREEALHAMKTYWGGMLADGADTFFEAYNLQNHNTNPYAAEGVETDYSCLNNSYCHAWSCTPSYFIRKLELT